MSGVCTDDDHALKVETIPPGGEETLLKSVSLSSREVKDVIFMNFRYSYFSVRLLK
jgi:hypothetical protein